MLIVMGDLRCGILLDVKTRARAVLATPSGTHNFSGDLGKVAVPAAVAFATTIVGWRAAAGGYGVLGLAAALAIVLLLARLATGGAAATPMRAPGYEGNGWGIRDARGFQALSPTGMIDNATRTGRLSFLPLALTA